MANGEEHAKETVMIQFRSVVDDLKGTGARNPEVHGAALLLLLQAFEPIFRARLITQEQCEQVHAHLAEQLRSDMLQKRPAFGWPHALAAVGSVAAVCLTVLQLAGRL